MPFSKTKGLILVSILILALGVGTIQRPAAKDASAETKRYPYEHVVRITATIEFDGERIEIDDLIDCRSQYEGPADRAAQLTFKASRGLFPYDTRDGGMVLYRVHPNVCSAFADRWAGVKTVKRLPNTWLPIIHWVNHRDANLADRGEIYYSETAIKNPNGRLKVIEDFRLSYPEQTEELVIEAAEQVVERDVWLGNPPRGSDAYLKQKRLNWYIKIPRELWSKPPVFRRYPDRPFDPDGLRELLDSVPDGEDLIYIGDMISGNDALWFSINDLLAGRWGGHYRAHAQAGIPQRDKPLWGMRINEATWDAAQIDIEKIIFFDDWVPLDLQDGTLTLRTDTPGMAYTVKGYGDWIRSPARPFSFLDRPLKDGNYDADASFLIFDTKTRDLRVASP